MYPKIQIFLTAIAVILGGSLAWATPPGKIISKIGAHCPSYYRADGHYCAPTAQAALVIPRIGNQCPSNYRVDKQVYCVALNDRAVADIVSLQGSRCPQNYRLQQGVYCVRYR